MTFETAFKKLKEKFVNVDASLLEDMAIQITISDEDCGGTFYAEVRNHVLAVEPYDYKDNDAIIDVTRAALTSLLDGKASIDTIIEKGDMTIMGDLAKVAAVKDAIKAPEKKPAAKKTTAKKPAVKKEAPAKKETAKKETAKKAPAKKETVKKEAAKAPAKKETVKKETAEAPAKVEAVKKTTIKETTKKTTAK